MIEYEHISFSPATQTDSFDLSKWWGGLWGGTSEADRASNISNVPTKEWLQSTNDFEFGDLSAASNLGTGNSGENLPGLLESNKAQLALEDALPEDEGSFDASKSLDYLSSTFAPSDYANLNANSLESTVTTGADAEKKVAANKPSTETKPNDAGKTNKDTIDWGKLLDSKLSAGVASTLIGGLLSGVGNAGTAKAKAKMEKEMLAEKYKQQLDYQQRTAPATISRREWKPILKSGLLGQK